MYPFCAIQNSWFSWLWCNKYITGCNTIQGLSTIKVRLVLCNTPRKGNVFSQNYLLILGLKSYPTILWHSSGCDQVRFSPLGLYYILSNLGQGRANFGVWYSALHLPSTVAFSYPEGTPGLCLLLQPLPNVLLGRLVNTCSCLGLLASVSKCAACASQQTISPVKYCDSLVNSTVRNVGNTGVAKPTSNYLICNCLFLYVQKLEKFWHPQKDKR